MCGGKGYMGHLCTLPSFCCEPKIVLKIQTFNKGGGQA